MIDAKTRKILAENRRKKAFKTENRLKVALYYSFELLVDVIIVLICIKAFSASFNFAHDIFVDSAKDFRSKEYVTVEIPPDSSSGTIAGVLYDSGVIKNKYVMMAKIKINEIGSKIKAGKYELSPSMRYSEIMNIITGGISTHTDEKKDDTNVATLTDATEIHDNSEMGAGEGTEGEDVPPEDGGDTSEGGDTDAGTAGE